MRQGAGHRHALLLAAGKFVRQAVHFIFQPDERERKRHARFDLFGGDVGHAHGKSDVLVHRHGGDQAEVLEHDAHLAAQVRHLAALELGQVLPVDENPPLGRLFFHLDEFEERRFARAGMAQDKDELAFLDMDIDIFQRYVFVVVRLVGFGDMFKFDHLGSPVGMLPSAYSYSHTYNRIPCRAPAVKAGPGSKT